MGFAAEPQMHPSSGPPLRPDGVFSSEPWFAVAGGTPAADGDFDGDGGGDILWRNNQTGENVLWYLNGTTYTSTVALPLVSDLNWFIAGTGDFNADGQTDILWHNNGSSPENTQRGSVSVWLMRGATYLTSAALSETVTGDWHLRGAGDFNGDGSPDIIWRNYTTGANVLWLLNGVLVTEVINLPSVSASGWNIYGSGDSDFDGSGTPDIVWRNSQTGANTIWLMNGTTYSLSVAIPSVSDLDWQISAVGEYNNDGKPDLVWRNNQTGANTIWLMNGTALVQTVALPVVGELRWKMVGPR
ncbi:MAG: VCBS repeat-containing protein [Aphanocapsa lilacina HA4352-LM1]|nr:VCBS repeat-containing protein [Aphanocapsa lilacina HA4352-LM1]